MNLWSYVYLRIGLIVRLSVVLSAVAYTQAARATIWKVSSAFPGTDEFSLSQATDGDLNTVAFLSSSASLQDAKKEDVCGTFVFEPEMPCQINRVRFRQSALSFALNYRITADTTGDGRCDKLLAEETRGNGLFGTWVEHQLETTKVYRVKLEGLDGLTMNSFRYPGIAEFEAYLADEPRTKVGNAVHVRVDTESLYSVNGVAMIQNDMFGVGGPLAAFQAGGVADRYLGPLNLHRYSLWSPRFLTDSILEDPDRPGKFDRRYFESGQFKREVVDPLQACFDRLKQMGLHADYRLQGAPSYMQDHDFVPSINTNKIADHYWPPKDSVEWGELSAAVMDVICRSQTDAVYEAHIWNEPNGKRRLPVPWSEKLSRYLNLFTNAAPVIKARIPQLEIAGPALTGGGLMGWGHDSPEGFNWVKQMVDEGGEALDAIDIHCYLYGSSTIAAEEQLYANYCMLSRGRVIPVVSSEGSWLMAGNISQRLNRNHYLLANQWAFNVRNFGNEFFSLLKSPDRFHGFSYFYMQGFAPDTTDIDHMFFDTRGNPNPVYWFYWALRDLRGTRLWVENPDHDLNIMTVQNGTRVVTVIQNISGQRKELKLEFRLPAGVAPTAVRKDYVEADLSANQLHHGTESLPLQGNVLHLAVAPLGVYALTAEGFNQPPSRAIRENEYFGNRVFAKLKDGIQQNIRIQVPAGAAGGAQKVYLRYGLMGEFCSAPYLMAEPQLPITVTVNGRRYEQTASKFNELVLPVDSVQEMNSITFQYHSESGTGGQSPPQIWVMSASLVVETPVELAK